MSRPRLAYKFYLELTPGELTEVFPVYDELSLNWRGEDGQFFKRRMLDGELWFARNDFDLIWAQSFDTEYIIHIYADLDRNGNYQPYWEGIFYKTMLTEVSTTRRECKVTPETNDKYRKIINGLNKKYNFIDLEPASVEVKEIQLSPMLQIYRPGSDYVSGYVGGVYFEEEATPTIDAFDLQAMGFYTYLINLEFIITGKGEGVNPDVSGRYLQPGHDDYPSVPAGISNPLGVREDGAYWLTQDIAGGGQGFIRTPSGSPVYQASANGTILDTSFLAGTISPLLSTGGNKLHLYSLTDPNDKVEVLSIPNFVARLLTVRTTVGGNPTTTLTPGSDIVADLGFYTRALPLELPPNFGQSRIKVTEATSTEPTRFGRVNEDAMHHAGEYHTFDDDLGPGNWYPIFVQDWDHGNAWIEIDDDLRGLIEDGASPYNLRDAYKLPDIISAFLSELNPDVTHLEDADHSEFYYTANDIRGTLKYPIFTPKSNIINRKYDRAATVSELSFGELLDFLWGAHRVGWYLDGDKFRLEHISYFDKGGDYTTEQIQADLTTEVEPRTGDSWSREKDFFTFISNDLPERLEFNWMDDSYLPFRGYPIEVLSQYALNGGVERFEAGLITSDIDYIQANSNSLNQKGLVYFECVQTEQGEFIVPYVSITIDATEQYNLQNGYASFVWMHENYHKWWLPGESVRLNRGVVAAESVRPVREQEIEYPYPDADPEWLPLITTTVGTGMIFEIQLSLTDRIATIKIRHATTS
jgi:hypothetical protein